MISTTRSSGVGIGGQPRASRRLAGSDRPTPNYVSHTTPLTVAAELGVVGLAALRLAARGRRAPARGGEPAASGRSGWRSARPCSRCSCTPCSTAASSRTRSPGSCSRWPRAGSSGRTRRTARARPRAGRGGRAPDERAAGSAALGALGLLGCCSRWCRHAARARLDPWPFRPATVDPQACWRRWCGPPARSGTWASPAPPLRRGAAVRRRGADPVARATGRAGGGVVLVLAVALLLARPRPSSSSACATPPSRGSSPTTRPTRSSSAASSAGRRQPLRARLPALGPRALLHVRRQRVRAGARARGGAAALRLLPRARRSPRPPGGWCPRRSTTTGCSCCSYARGAAAASRSGRRSRGGSPWARCSCCNPIAVRSAWFGQNDAPSLLLMVLAFALVTRARSAGPPRPRRRRAAEAVRARRAAVPGADAVKRAPTARAASAPALVFAAVLRAACCRS